LSEQVLQIFENHFSKEFESIQWHTLDLNLSLDLNTL
jgi:hypothetical protein